ncbi:uncharacterized protein LOC109542261 [Dendroctonus ponderosae]|uniref:uncharacterized protein LOC109542261 n=1 Tax=Dendroctonus ponderosae TaxID=77166 RepID=UPI002035EFDC|nr:uncharacterized protein LOC109542261 [Dendroctonus ponderosae]KAH1008943.1 hypothetical protein HUJ05_009434 [Dendroctonus ponderosae]
MSLPLHISGPISIDLLDEHVECLVDHRILTEKEARNVVTTIRYNDESVLSDRSSQTYRRAIQFESGLISQISRRRQSSNLALEGALLAAESYFKCRVGEFYMNLLSSSPDDADLRSECIQFFTYFQHEVEMFKRILPAFNKASVEKTQSAPEVVRVAAAWHSMNGSPVQTRAVLFKGATQNPKNVSLYLDILKFELDSNCHSSKITYLKECVNLMIKHVSNRFMQETIILLDKSEVEEAAKYAVDKYEEHFKDHVETWLFLSSRELKGNFKTHGARDKYSANLAAVKRVVAKFKEGIAKLPAKSEPELWQAYLAFMVLQKNKSPEPEIIKLARNAFEDAYKTKGVELTEHHYAAWVDCYEDKNEFQPYRFQYAVNKDPTSELLWCLYLSSVLQVPNNIDKAHELLREATKAVGPDAIRLFDLFIKACMLNSKNRTVAVFQEALSHSDITASHFKPAYFTYTLVSFGLQPARDCYNTISKTRPYSKQLHKDMLEAERLRQLCDGKPSSRIPEILKLWTDQLGHCDLEVYRVHMEWVLEKAKINADDQQELNGQYSTIQEELLNSLSEIYSAAREKLGSHDQTLLDELGRIYEEVRAKVLEP